MDDPTEMVMRIGFAVSAGMFLAAAALRAGAGGRLVAAWLGSGSRESLPAEGQERRAGIPTALYDARDLVGIVFVYLVFSAMVLGSLATPKPEDFELKESHLWVNIGFQFMMAMVVIAVVSPRIGMTDWLGLKWKKWISVLWLAPGSVLGMWLVFEGLRRAGYLEWIESMGVETVQDSVKLLREGTNARVLWLMGFAGVIVAPLCEEVVFRGYLYPAMKRFAGMWPAALGSALLFGCAHGSLMALLPLFLFGGCMVFLYERTGSIWAPIAAHCCFNGATVFYQIAARVEGMTGGS